MKKKTILMILLLCAVLAAAGGFVFLRRRPQKGVEVSPSAASGLPQVVYYRQKDDRWKDDKLGTSSYTLGGSGCLTSCIASALSIQATADPGYQAYTPAELNRLFSENGVYNASGDIVWDRIKQALPDAEVQVESSVSSRLIDSWLAQDIYPLARVKNHGDGAVHWVLITGSDEDGYYCMDPLQEEGEPTSLSVHGNKIYSLRAVYRPAG